VIRISSGSAFEPEVGYCRVVVTPDGWVFVSGCVGNDHETMIAPAAVEDQCSLALGHVGAALKQAGAGFRDVVRVTYMLPDRRDFPLCFPLLRGAFGDNPPAATMIECGLIDPVYKIEIEVTARLPL
jgi:enamine deaminase RidA (YjgF/YER057c/UK114 family)